MLMSLHAWFFITRVCERVNTVVMDYIFVNWCVCVLSLQHDCVFPQLMVVDHSSRSGSEPLNVGWIVFVCCTTRYRTLSGFR